MHIWFLTLALVVATCVVGYVLPEYKSLDFFALLLTVIAGVYVGFALKDGRPRIIVIESLVAAGFIVIALIGLWKDPVWLVVGYFLHGGWDLFNHYTDHSTQAPRWYPPACVIYDWIIGAFIFYMWSDIILG